MPLIDTLRAAQLDFRKTGIKEPTHKRLALTLGTVIGEATKVTKEPANDETLKALRKVRAGVQELQAYSHDDFRGIEIATLSLYIPETLSECQIVDALHALPDDYEIDMKGMKAIKTALEDKYPGRVDGALLAKVVKEWGTN